MARLYNLPEGLSGNIIIYTAGWRKTRRFPSVEDLSSVVAEGWREKEGKNGQPAKYIGPDKRSV